MNKIKVITVIGTRPEIIRLSEIIRKFDTNFEHILIHSGQNYDPNLNSIFFQDLELRAPDIYLNIQSDSLGTFLGTLFSKIEVEFIKFKPEAVFVLGDTNSALSTIIAKRLSIPVYHLEAGNRSFDENVPEETNRRIVDQVADFNFVYTEHARRNLLREGLHPRNICLTGSPLVEVFSRQMEKIKSSRILESLSLKPNNYFLVSLHRQENVDFPQRLNQILQGLNLLAETFNQQIIISTHPRTQKILSLKSSTSNSLLKFEKPFNFSDYNQLQRNARLVLSDSGTISEESAILGFKAVTIRDSMERPEALEHGSVFLGSTKAEMILRIVDIALNSQLVKDYPIEYKIQNCSDRVLNFIISTLAQHKFWNSLHTNQ